MTARWEWGAFRTATSDGGAAYRSGSFWGAWGVYKVARQRTFVVTHLASGCRLTEFDSLAIARRFCERIDGLTDWQAQTADTSPDPDLVLQVHRAALAVTGARPQLEVVPGGAA